MTKIILILSICLLAVVLAWSRRGHHSAPIPASIENLHQDDIAATIGRDADALTALWDDDAILLQPGTPPIIGKAAFHDFMTQALSKSPSVKVVKYIRISATFRLQETSHTSGDTLTRAIKVPSSRRPKACMPSCFVF
jgi:ketosteroid isomerase-like protein